MAGTAQKDLLGRLADVGEDAFGRLADLPGGGRVVEAVHGLRERVDELTQRVRSIDPLARKVAELDQRLEALEGKKPTRSAGTKKSA